MKNIILDLIQVSEETAIAASKLVGKNDQIAADAAAVNSMRAGFNKIDFKGKVIIGEGERDEAPMLFIGEVVGASKGDVKYDIAVDPLECTTRCAKGDGGSMVAMVVAEKGHLLAAPDVYMKKIASACHEVDLDASVEENLIAVSTSQGVDISNITVAVLDRDRHSELVNEILSAGAKIKLISDGDIAVAIMACMAGSGVDIYMGIGGAPEGVIAAAAISMLGGKMESKLLFKNESERKRAASMIDCDIDSKFSQEEMSRNGELAFIISGITPGELLSGADNCMIDTICIYRNSTGNILNRRILTNRC